MALSNFIVTCLGVGAVVMLMRTDVRHSSQMLKRNLRQLRSWLDEAGEATGKAVQEEVKQVSAPKPPPQQPPKHTE